MCLQVPVHLCGSAEQQYMNSFAYIFCDKPVVLCSWALTHTSHIVLFWCPRSLSSFVKKQYLQNFKTLKSFEVISKIEWILHRNQSNWIISEFLLRAKSCRVRTSSCFSVGTSCFLSESLCFAVSCLCTFSHYVPFQAHFCIDLQPNWKLLSMLSDKFHISCNIHETSRLRNQRCNSMYKCQFIKISSVSVFLLLHYLHLYFFSWRYSFLVHIAIIFYYH